MATPAQRRELLGEVIRTFKTASFDKTVDLDQIWADNMTWLRDLLPDTLKTHQR